MDEEDFQDPEIEAQLATVRQSREMNGFEKDIDVRRLVLQIAGAGDINIANSLVTGEVDLTILGSSQIIMTVHDQARAILQSRNLVDDDGQLKAVDIHLDGLWWRLVKLQKQGDDLNLTFEERQVARLRAKKGPRLLGTRNKITRAEAILMLIRSVKAEHIHTHINELHKRQPVKGATKAQKKQERDRKRSKGFDDGVTLEGKEGPLGATQLNNASRAIAVADDLNAPDTATLALIETCIVEGPDFKNPNSGTGSSVGMLQLTDDHYHGSVSARRDIEKICTQFLEGPAFTGGPDGAIALARKNPSWSPGRIAQTIQGSGYGSRYDQYRGKARAILKEWGSTAGTARIFKKYAFRVDKKETYWDAIQRLADDVKWRAFFSGGEFYYISEEDLFKSRARFRITEGEHGVTNVDGDQDYRKRFHRITISCRIDRWRCPPGTIVILKDLGSMNGRYLVESVTRNLYSSEATIECKKPTAERKEPRADVRNQGQGAQVVDTGVLNTDGGAKGIVDQCVTIAQAAGGSSVYVGSSYRPGSVVDSGQPSDHSQNNENMAARDIGKRGVDLLVGPPSHELDLACVAIGNAFDRDYGNGKHGPFQNADSFHWRGYRIQIIWRTPQWGGHMGHVHVGVKADSVSRPSVRQKHGGRAGV